MIFKKIHFFHFSRFFNDFLAFLAAQSGEAFGGRQSAKCICWTGIARHCFNPLKIKQTAKGILFLERFWLGWILGGFGVGTGGRNP